jgi:uncharacterized membrane protein HdeD (DUF308 family)
MAKGSGTKIKGPVMGILAIIAGALILLGLLPLYLVVGIYLIIYGVIAIIER